MTSRPELDLLAPALTVGTPDVHGALAVFPVFGAEPVLQYRSFAEACGLGATVTERPSGASVNDLVVTNPLDVAVLLYEGEELRGAQQDRTLDVSVLVPAGAKLEVPVSCVEAGRWDGTRKDEAFAPAPTAAFPELRRAKNRAARAGASGRAEQGEVWSLVADKVQRHAAAAPTGALRDVFARREDDLAAMRAAVRRRDGQIGAVAAIGGTLCVADVVGRADVFAALHGPLVAGYALDAAEHAGVDVLPPEPGAGEAVERFLTAALTAATAPRPGVGLGREHRFTTPAAEGIRLEHDGELVALTAFPGQRRGARIRRPSARRG